LLDSGQLGKSGGCQVTLCGCVFQLLASIGDSAFKLIPLLVPAQMPLDDRFAFTLSFDTVRLYLALKLLFCADLGRQGGLVLEPGSQEFEFFVFCLHPGKSLLRNLREGFGASQGLQQFGAFIVSGFQKGGKVILGQQHGTGELVKVQANK